MICESCNKSNKDNVGFCEYCGAALRRTDCSCVPDERYITTGYARLEPAVRLNLTDKERENTSCGFKNTIIFKIISLIFPFFGFILAFFFNKSHKEVSRVCLKFAIIGCVASFIFGTVSSGIIPELIENQYIESPILNDVIYDSYADCEAKILEVYAKADKEVGDVVVIKYEFENLSDNETNFYSNFVDLVYQNDMVLDAVVLDGSEYFDNTPFDAVSPNSSVEFEIAYKLINNYDDVDIKIVSESDGSTIATVVYEL